MKLAAVTVLGGLSLWTATAATAPAGSPVLVTYAITIGPDTKGAGICVARADGSHRRRLTRWGYREPDWSPRGRFMVVRRGGIGAELQVADARGRARYGLPYFDQEADVSLMEPSWSPGGSRIAYTAQALSGWGAGSASIVIVTRTGVTVRRLEANYQEAAGSPTWSPDGARLAYDKDVRGMPTSIYTSRANGTGRQLVITAGSEPDWSPDGSRLAYVDSSGDVASSNIDGSNVRVLTASSERESKPAWSPDGRLIAFERTNQATGRTWIVVVRSGTGEQVGVIRGPFDARDPAWRPPTALPKAKRPPCH